MNMEWLELWIQINEETWDAWFKVKRYQALANYRQVSTKELKEAGFNPREIARLRKLSARYAKAMLVSIIDLLRITEIRGWQI